MIDLVHITNKSFIGGLARQQQRLRKWSGCCSRMAWTEGGEGLILGSSSYSKMVLTKGVDQPKRSGDEEKVQLWPRRGDDGAEDDKKKQRRRWSLIDSRERHRWCCSSDQERSRERWWCCWIPRLKEKSMLLDLREEDDGANKRRREGINRWRHALNWWRIKTLQVICCPRTSPSCLSSPEDRRNRGETYCNRGHISGGRTLQHLFLAARRTPAGADRRC